MFISSYSLGRRRSRGQLWAILTSAVAVHVLALGTLVAMQAWHVEAVAEPPACDVFQVQLPLPPLPAPPAAPAPGASLPRRSQAPAAPVPPRTEAPPPAAGLARLAVPPRQPADVPAVAPPLSQGGSVADREGGDLRALGSGGSADGGADGSGGGGGGGAGSGDEPLAVGGPISRPQVLHRVQPLYTERARQARSQGSVILRATLDEQGNVIAVLVLKSLPCGLDEEAVKAVRQWKFTPGLLRGLPVKVYFNLTVNFQVE